MKTILKITIPNARENKINLSEIVGGLNEIKEQKGFDIVDYLYMIYEIEKDEMFVFAEAIKYEDKVVI